MAEQKLAVAFIDSTQPNAPEYYRKFQKEPVLPSETISVGSPICLSNMTTSILLENIINNVEKYNDILIVSHGTADGLSIPIHKNSEAKLQTNALDVLQNYESGKVNADDVAPRLYFSKPEFLQFWELVKKVRNLKINRVELRCCLVGCNVNTLEKLKSFFGSASCSAPTDLDVFGTINPGQPGPDAIRKLLKKCPKAKITGNPPHRFALDVGIMGEFNAAADSKTAIDNWISFHLPGGSKVKFSGQPIPVHGIYPSRGAERIIWAGEKAYRRFLAKV